MCRELFFETLHALSNKKTNADKRKSSIVRFSCHSYEFLFRPHKLLEEWCSILRWLPIWIVVTIRIHHHLSIIASRNVFGGVINISNEWYAIVVTAHRYYDRYVLRPEKKDIHGRFAKPIAYTATKNRSILAAAFRLSGLSKDY